MKPPPKLLLRISVIVVALVLALVLAGYYVLVVLEWPGGMRSTYGARDQDARLTREAATALPVIAALERYHTQHASFPEDLSVLRDVAPADPGEKSFWPDSAGSALGWRYYRQGDGAGYVLSRKLGWDPMLEYHSDGDPGLWVFDPGDGSDEKPILLKP